MIHLCFHGIGECRREREPGEARYWISTDIFQRTLDLAAQLPDVILSFDDGNKSDIEIGLPALKDRGLKATFFALAGRLEDPVSLQPEDLRQLRRAGMSIGTHGWDHIPWRALTPEQQQRELADARVALSEASDGPIQDAAMPLGRYDRQLLRQLKNQRYRHVFTSDRLPASASTWIQPRYSLVASDTTESVQEVLAHRFRLGDLRNLAASVVKRMR